MTVENWLVLLAAIVIAVVPAAHVEYRRRRRRYPAKRSQGPVDTEETS